MTKIRDEDTGKFIIGEATPVRIGLILGFLGIFATAIWWAASINSKLDTILTYQTTSSNTFAELKAKDITIEAEISEFKLKEALVEVAVKTLADKFSDKSSNN